jgi:hypothetical protein
MQRRYDVRYVETYEALRSHGRCEAEPWLKRITFAGELRGLFHSNVQGQATLAELIERAARLNMRLRTARRLFLGAAVAAVSLAFVAAAPALASPTIELTRGNAEPVESITTQLGSIVSNAGDDEFFLHVKPTGGEGCAANPDADAGEDVISSDVSSETSPISFSQNWTFRLAGNYRVCAWVTTGDIEEVLASAEATFHVRQPHLALSVSVPATVAPNQTFQIMTTAQAETERSVWEYVLPNTGAGCPANAAAASNASGSRTVLYSWNVTGGPFTESKNESLQSPGAYLVCSYFEYPNTESTPEFAANAEITVVAPPALCVVPAFAFGAALGSVEDSLHGASCSVGAIHYTTSTSVRRGGVLGLNPDPGTKLGAGAAVAIDVSAGGPCVVPSVKAGTNVRHVEHLLTTAHCGFVVVHAQSRRVRRGTVIGLGSRAHSHLFPLTPVRVVVSSGR